MNNKRVLTAELEDRYRRGKVGDSEVKSRLAAAINRLLDPIRARRAHYEAQPGLVQAILAAGNQRMHEESEETMALVREAMSLPSADFLPARRRIASPPGLIYC